MKIVYNSFSGRYSDNPRALFEKLWDRPGLSHIWLADPAHQQTFPAGVTTVPNDGPQATEALESADLVIANSHTEVEWSKPADATYLQTWHGTPLKRIHRDVLWAPPGRLDRLDRDVAKWDLLLSPNAASTPRLRAAFRFARPVIETGYPRNDVLLSRQRDAVRERVRAEFGVHDGVTAVLYAPTWRDDETLRDPAAPIRTVLDLELLQEQIGGDHVLLVRSHSMVTGRASIAALPAVRDVSYYADIAPLYLAADVLVTDYSSAMFDFAITGKPIVYFAYDLQRFADSVRGFYFDLTRSAPGPLLHDSKELVSALSRLPEISAAHAARYNRFRRTYCALEDGRAADRVLALLGL